jgi:SAM-dependent methyltransferase
MAMLELVELLPALGHLNPALIEQEAAMLFASGCGHKHELDTIRRRSLAKGEKRTPERILHHYRVERELAERLRQAGSPEERQRLFPVLYGELFRKVPDHPRLLAHESLGAMRARDIQWDLAQLRPFLRPGAVFLEIGAGDCALSSEVARQAKTVYAIDVAEQTGGAALPANVRRVLSDGRSIPVPEGSVDVAFSDQLMEHLHPEDAAEQLRNIYRSLRPGGVYICITPNKLYGPSDISAYFDDVARGFHLREYSLAELRRVFFEAGFSRLQVFAGARGVFVRCPAWPLLALESVLSRLPARVRRGIAGSRLARALLGLRVAACKPRDSAAGAPGGDAPRDAIGTAPER